VVVKGVQTVQSVYRLRIEQLDERFLNALRVLFENKRIEISVSEIGGRVGNGAANRRDCLSTSFACQSKTSFRGN
jgi:hypothetical protein